MKTAFLTCILFFTSFNGRTQTSTATVMGKIKDQTTGELLPFVRITLIQHDTIKYVGETDFDGQYKIKEVKPGIYNVKTTVIGYYSKEINGFLAKGSMINFLNIELNPEPS